MAISKLWRSFLLNGHSESKITCREEIHKPLPRGISLRVAGSLFGAKAMIGLASIR